MNVADEIRRIENELKGIKIRLGDVRVSSQVFSVPPTKTISISPSFTDNATTLKYSTIQAALTANAEGGELFLVYPGTYTDDTIHLRLITRQFVEWVSALQNVRLQPQMLISATFLLIQDAR